MRLPPISLGASDREPSVEFSTGAVTKYPPAAFRLGGNTGLWFQKGGGKGGMAEMFDGRLLVNVPCGPR